MNDRYTYRTAWSAEDREHVGRCAEFPLLSWLAPTSEEALAAIQNLVQEVLVDMRETGESPPKALADRRLTKIR